MSNIEQEMMKEKGCRGAGFSALKMPPAPPVVRYNCQEEIKLPFPHQ